MTWISEFWSPGLVTVNLNLRFLSVYLFCFFCRLFIFFKINFMYEILTHNVSPKIMNKKGVGWSLLDCHTII